VLLAQLNIKTATEHATPQMSHIKDCGSMLEDACWVWVLDRIEADTDRFDRAEKARQKLEAEESLAGARMADVRGKVWIDCAKDRNGTMGGYWKLPHIFDRRCGRIADLSYRGAVSGEVQAWAQNEKEF